MVQVRCSRPPHGCAWKELRFSSYISGSRNTADCAKNTRTRSVLFGVETHELKEKIRKKITHCTYKHVLELFHGQDGE